MQTDDDSGGGREEISFGPEPDLDAESFAEILGASGLGERRPVDNLALLGTMLRNASIVVTARAGGKLVGVARGLSDRAFCFYLSDLAVHRDWQGRGIGRELIRRSHELAGDTLLVLLAAPEAQTYYPHIGLSPFAH